MSGLIVLLICLGIAIAGVLIKISGLRRQQRRKRYSAGKCMNCGYDIRINTHRCPECGGELVPQSVEYWREFVEKRSR